MERILVYADLHRSMGRLGGFKPNTMKTLSNSVPDMLREVAPIKVTSKCMIGSISTMVHSHGAIMVCP